jgi:beta-alanine degradation protein BauB
MKAGLSALEFTDRFLAPWNAHDIDAVLASLPADFVWQFTTGSAPAGALYRGAGELRSALERLFRAVPDIHYRVVDVHEGPELLVMELAVTGTNRETSATLDFQACDIVLFDGDRPREKRSYRKVVTPA